MQYGTRWVGVNTHDVLEEQERRKDVGRGEETPGDFTLCIEQCEDFKKNVEWKICLPPRPGICASTMAVMIASTKECLRPEDCRGNEDRHAFTKECLRPEVCRGNEDPHAYA